MAVEEWVSFPALGSTATLGVADPGPRSVADAVAIVRNVVDGFDEACSRFREDSELAAVNAAGGEPLRVSELLLDAVSEALRAARLTDGAVDLTVGGALIALGYDRDFAIVGAAERPALIPVPGWRAVEVDRDAGTVRVARGVTIDLGATAKALAADRAAARAGAATGHAVLVSLGGDIALAGRSPPAGWRVRVTDDHRAGTAAPGQWITVRSGGVATSSTTARRWGASHHLIDPATGGSTDGPWRTVSVAAGSCLDANIASTAAIVRGRGAVGWLESVGLPARLVSVHGTVRHLGGWPGQGDDLS